MIKRKAQGGNFSVIDGQLFKIKKGFSSIINFLT